MARNYRKVDRYLGVMERYVAISVALLVVALVVALIA